MLHWSLGKCACASPVAFEHWSRFSWSGICLLYSIRTHCSTMNHSELAGWGCNDSKISNVMPDCIWHGGFCYAAEARAKLHVDTQVIFLKPTTDKRRP